MHNNIKLLKVFKHIKYKDKIYLDNLYEYYEKLNYIEIIYFLLIMICRCIFNLFSLITIKYFTPSHIIFILIIGELELFIDRDWKSILSICIAFVMMLIFTEILELNFFGLSENTRKNIMNRAKIKNIESIDNENDIENSDLNDDSNIIQDGFEISIVSRTDSF